VICWTRFPSTDELLSQFFSGPAVQLSRASKADSPTAGRVAVLVRSRIGPSKLGNASEATEDAA
jgi:hypothetical protein